MNKRYNVDAFYNPIRRFFSSPRILSSVPCHTSWCRHACRYEFLKKKNHISLECIFISVYVASDVVDSIQQPSRRRRLSTDSHSQIASDTQYSRALWRIQVYG